MNKLLPYIPKDKSQWLTYTTINYDHCVSYITFFSDGTVIISDGIYETTTKIHKRYYKIVLKQVRAIWGEYYTPKLTNIQLI